MRLLLVTGNRHKFDEMSQILKEFGIELVQKEVELIEPDFSSQGRIAEYKALQAFEKFKEPVVCEDTGVYFDGYNNFPGVLAKRVFSGLGFDGLTAIIRATKNRNAHFKTVVSYFDGKTMKSFSGVLRGKLIEKTVSVDKDRLPYEKIFVPEGFSDALVNISLEEKNKVSHRAIATREFGKWLNSKK